MKLPALPLPAALSPERLATLVDAEKAALVRARFAAWWNGVDFDADAFAAAKAERQRAVKAGASSAAPNARTAEERDLFDQPIKPDAARIDALGRVWGAGRMFPGSDDDERLHLARMGAPAGAPVAIIGPGGVAPLKAIGRGHIGPITVFEWREGAIDSLKQHTRRLEWASRLTLTGIELDQFSPPSGTFDGVISFDDLTFAASPQGFCQKIASMLSPSGVAIIEAYCQTADADMRTAFSSAFAEPKLLPVDETIDMLFEAGLRVDSQDDVTDEHLRLVREAFRRLSGVLEAGAGMPAEVAREIAWEAEAWRARVALLSKRVLVRRQFVLSRRPDAA